MDFKTTVKAREHYGAESLDLTIPAKIKKEYGIYAGDIFEIVPEESDGGLLLKYKRVYSVKR